MSAARGVQTALALVLCAAAPAVALAAEPLSGPVAGYIFDGASRGPGQTPRGIRPIYGIPGSAMLGAPVTLPFPVDFAVLSASGEFALARSASPDQPVWVIQGLAGAQPSLTPLPGALADARIVMNAQGSAAVLYSASKLQFVWGLPDQPTAGEAIALPDWHGRYSAIAVSGVSVSKDGSWALLAVTGEPEGLVRVRCAQDRVAGHAQEVYGQ